MWERKRVCALSRLNLHNPILPWYVPILMPYRRSMEASFKEGQLKNDVKAKSLLLMTTQREVDKNSKVLVNLKALPTLSRDDVKELKRHEEAMLDMQSSLNLDTWMDTN